MDNYRTRRAARRHATAETQDQKGMRRKIGICHTCGRYRLLMVIKDVQRCYPPAQKRMQLGKKAGTTYCQRVQAKREGVPA